MANDSPHDGNQKHPPTDGALLLPDSDERARQEQAERENAEREYKKLILDLQTRQTNAQGTQARAALATTYLSGALLVLTLVGGWVSYLQFQAAHESAKAANDAVGVARDTLNSGNESFSKTLTEMRRQVEAAEATAKATGGALDLARTNFIKDQRPYVLNAEIIPEPQLPNGPGRPMSWRLVSKNFGRSPAINMKSRAGIFVGGRADIRAISFFRNLPQGDKAQPTLPPGETLINTISTPTPISLQQFAFTQANDYGVAIAGRIDYQDLAGTAYYTEFCRTWFANGAITFCERNSIH